jgi:hypothetical protein
MSRLQGIQSAISVELDNLEDDDACALITFSDCVSIFGDGSQPNFASGDELNVTEALLKKGAQNPFDSLLKKNRKSIQDHLWKLEPCGPTALGPALVVSLGMASQHPGTTVILATDGLANVGVGSLDSGANGKHFYEEMAEYALNHSTVINVLSLAGSGEKVNLSLLGVLNSKTGGTMDLISPSTAIEQVKEILRSEVIATNASVSIMTHHLFQFVTHDNEVHKSVSEADADPKGKEKLENLQPKNQISKYVGVVSPHTEIPFTFEVTKGSISQMPENLPFQVQIRYTRLDGTKVFFFPSFSFLCCCCCCCVVRLKIQLISCILGHSCHHKYPTNYFE